jgi:competence protein ComEC
MPLFWLSLAFLAGIGLADGLNWPPGMALPGSACWILASLFLAAAIFLEILRPRLVARRLPPFPYTLIPLFITLGALRYQGSQPRLAPDSIAWYNNPDREAVVEGWLVEPPDERDGYTNLRVSAEQISLAEEEVPIPVHGLLLARLPPGGGWRYGDRVRLQGRLESPPENESFSYRDYLARQGVYSYMSRASAEKTGQGRGSRLLAWVYAVKERALGVVRRIFPDPEGALLAGILLGEDNGLPAPLRQAYNDTGTAHIIAISGFNISILSGLIAGLAGRLLGPRRGALAAGAAIGAYTLLVGAAPSVVRAALMGGLSLFARQVGRRQQGLNSLALTAAGMSVFNPNLPWDVGFQLSFMATLGLVLYAEPLSQAFTALASRRLPAATVQRLAGPVGEYFLFTLAAQITSLPVTVYHFQRLSLTSLLANPLVLPAQPAVMVLGGLAVLLGLLALPLGQMAAYLAWPFAAYTNRVVALLGQVPGGVIILGRSSLLWVALFYVLLFAAPLLAPRLKGAASLLKPSIILAAVGIITVLVWQAALSLPDGKLHVTLLPVSAAGRSGEAALVQGPKGQTVLVGGGPSATLLTSAVGQRLPLTRRRLDALIVTASGADQLDALPAVVRRYPPGMALWAGPLSGSASARMLQESLTQADVSLAMAEAGQSLDLGEGARLELLAVTRRGAVLLVSWGSFRALLPIGLDLETLDTLQADPSLIGVTALLLPESGYAPLCPPGWVRRLDPQVVLLSVAAGDREGRPSPETLEAVEDYTLLRTDRNGWIELSTDGEQMWVEVEGR